MVQFFADRPDLEASSTEYTLNRLMPPDVRVRALRRTAPDFLVTISAVSKVYHFCLDVNPEHNPLTHRFRMHVPKPLNLEAMKSAMTLMQVWEGVVCRSTSSACAELGANTAQCLEQPYCITMAHFRLLLWAGDS